MARSNQKVVPEAKAEDLMSKHLSRGKVQDNEEYDEYERDKIVGVFGGWILR